MEQGGFVYIMTNKNHTVLYTGVTSDLINRVQQHIHQLMPGSFTSRYNINKLVYYSYFPQIELAIAEEKRIKAGNRQSKLQLIENINQAWDDLWIKEVAKW
jgi:putative endonuclease